jgi:hypothetical protein
MTQSAILSPDDRHAITTVMYRFYRLVDQGHADQTAALFTPTARLTFGPGSPKPGTLTGDQIPPAMIARGQQTHVTTRHVLSNIQLEPKADGTVEAYSLLTLFRSEDDSRDSYPASVADIIEVFARHEGAWKVQSRDILPVFGRL